jgi:hypothetical protein
MRYTNMKRLIHKAEVAILIVSILVMSITFVAAEDQTMPPILKDYRDGYVYMPEDGFVPDDSTAIRIAEAVWLPLYGESIYDSQPFVARLEGDSVWIVEGTLPEEYMLGGTPYAEIRKSDAGIIRVTHFE